MAINVTENALRKIKETLERENMAEGGLRLGIRGGGCSGLNYVLRFEAEKKAGDKVIEQDGARILVDFKSMEYLKGVTLDWESNLMQEGFTFRNPNAKKSCSCGDSFCL